jgi:two-component system response regulator YesN
MWLTPLLRRCALEELRRELQAVLGGGWATALLEGVRDQPLKEIEEVLVRSVPQALFYYSGEGGLPRLQYGELKAMAGREERAAAEEEPLVNARNLRWTLERGEWEVFIAAVLSRQPAQEAVAGFGRELLHSWSGLLLKPEEAGQLELAAYSNRNWCQWKSWLRQFSDQVQRRMIELGMSKEVMFCLITAVRYMRSHAGDKINQGDVAAAINMSRGYFSQCFARFAGETFGESLRGMRLELAKSLLLETHAPVCEIACRSGFEDDRYFSRLFRERVGKLPSEYRAEGMER